MAWAADIDSNGEVLERNSVASVKKEELMRTRGYLYPLTGPEPERQHSLPEHMVSSFEKEAVFGLIFGYCIVFDRKKPGRWTWEYHRALLRRTQWAVCVKRDREEAQIALLVAPAKS
jgi:hypothetical protein